MQKIDYNIIMFLIVTTFLVLLMAGFIITIVYLYRRKQAAFEKQLEEIKSNYQNNLLSAQLEQQEEVFQNVSREIHDNISLSLTLAKLELHTADWSNPQAIKGCFQSANEHISTAIVGLSDISRNMNADIIMQRGLLAALDTEIIKLKKTQLYEVTMLITGEPFFMDGERELILFRIVQESLNNFIKHAKAKKLHLILTYKPNLLQIIITDDGSGFDINTVASKKSAGLLNMKKRVEMINGIFTIQSIPALGTTIIAEIPFYPS